MCLRLLPLFLSITVNLYQDPHFPSLLRSTSTLGGDHNIHLEIMNGTDERLSEGDIMMGGECKWIESLLLGGLAEGRGREMGNIDEGAGREG